MAGGKGGEGHLGRRRSRAGAARAARCSMHRGSSCPRPERHDAPQSNKGSKAVRVSIRVRPDRGGSANTGNWELHPTKVVYKVERLRALAGRGLVTRVQGQHEREKNSWNFDRVFRPQARGSERRVHTPGRLSERALLGRTRQRSCSRNLCRTLLTALCTDTAGARSLPHTPRPRTHRHTVHTAFASVVQHDLRVRPDRQRQDLHHVGRP